MNQILAHLEITRLAYNEAHGLSTFDTLHKAEREYKLLKNMQQKVDKCLLEPSLESVERILAQLS